MSVTLFEIKKKYDARAFILSLASFIYLICVAPSLAADVPYYSQYKNEEEGHRACNITSVAMILDHFNISVEGSNALRTPDKLYERFGIKQNPEELWAIFNIIARESQSKIRGRFLEQGTITQLRQQVQEGNPVIIHGWFTKSGHILVVTGFDGENYIVNDPGGRWNLKKFSDGNYDKTVSGHGIKYPAKEFEYAINDNGKGNDLWLHIFEPK